MTQAPAVHHAAVLAIFDREASVDAAIEACDGNVRTAIWELLTERVHLENEAERLAGAVSRGYVRWDLLGRRA